MARPFNILKTIILKISATKPMVSNLEELVTTGLYGKNPTEAAERLIAKGLQELQKEGYIEKRRIKKPRKN